VPAAGARCEAARRNCRSFLVARFPRAASGLARDIPGSSTARSSRTVFASFRLAGHADARRNRRRPPRKSLLSQLLEVPPKNWRDCAPSSLGVSIEIDTISWGTLPAGKFSADSLASSVLQNASVPVIPSEARCLRSEWLSGTRNLSSPTAGKKEGFLVAPLLGMTSSRGLLANS
jgi:hypothetical protein